MINNISYYVEIKQVVIKTQLKNMSNLVSEINKFKIRTDGNAYYILWNMNLIG